ncbi:MAG: hypothetical protein R2827_03255 [Bdellovibrionales bacterium]
MPIKSTILSASRSFNYFLNGNFKRWNRGSSKTSNGGLASSADRWWFFSSAGKFDSMTGARMLFTRGQSEVEGNPEFYIKFNINGPIGTIHHRIHKVETLSGKNVTLALYLRDEGASTTGPVNLIVRQKFGSGGSPTREVFNTNFSMPASWQKLIFNISIPNIAGQIIGTDNKDNLEIEINTAWNAFSMAQTLLIEGKESDPLFRLAAPSQAAEDALLRGYYQKTYSDNIDPLTFTSVGIKRGIVGKDGFFFQSVDFERMILPPQVNIISPLVSGAAGLTRFGVTRTLGAGANPPYDGSSSTPTIIVIAEDIGVSSYSLREDPSTPTLFLDGYEVYWHHQLDADRELV